MADECKKCTFYNHLSEFEGECRKSSPRMHPATRQAMWPPRAAYRLVR